MTENERKDRKYIFAIIFVTVFFIAAAAGAWAMREFGQQPVIEMKSFFTPREMSGEENLYSIPAEVTEIHREKDLIFFVDMRGEEYAFVSDLAWEVGDEITVIFDSRGTGDLTDDIVINVNWLGEWEG